MARMDFSGTDNSCLVCLVPLLFMAPPCVQDEHKGRAREGVGQFLVLSLGLVYTVIHLCRSESAVSGIFGTRERVPAMKEQPAMGQAESVPPRRLYPSAV